MNYTFAPSAPAPLLRRHLHLGGSNPKGEQIAVTSRYLERNARPWLPVMGEYHFVRDNRENWYRELCKMKAGGVDLVGAVQCDDVGPRLIHLAHRVQIGGDEHIGALVPLLI